VVQAPDYHVAIEGRNDLYGDELDRTFFLNSQNSDTSEPPILISMRRARSLLSRRRLGNRCTSGADCIVTSGGIPENENLYKQDC
jgi:hypothetical protein